MVLMMFGQFIEGIITIVIDCVKHHRDCLFNQNLFMKTLAERLKIKRGELGLSQKELATKAELKNQSIIGMLEAGSRKSSSYVPQIANALGVDPLWLATGEGSPEHKVPSIDRKLADQLGKLSYSALQLAIDYDELDQEAQLDVAKAMAIAQGDSKSRKLKKLESIVKSSTKKN